MKNLGNVYKQCTMCLGIIQRYRDICVQIKDELGEWDYNKLKIKIQLCNSISIREYIIKEKIGMKGEVQNLKQIMKQLIGRQLQKVYGYKICKQQSKDIAIIRIQYRNNQDNQKQLEHFRKYLQQQHANRKQKKIQKIQSKIHPNKLNVFQHLISLSNQNIQKILKSNIKPETISHIYLSNHQIPKTIHYISINTFNIFIKAKYAKYSRFIPQTPLSLTHIYIPQTTVQQQIQKGFNIIPNFKTQFKFHGGGRQDIDVRMLNQNRIFAIQLVNPRSKLDLNKQKLKEIKNEINKSSFISISDLQLTDVRCLQEIKQMQDNKRKVYVVIVRSNKELNEQMRMKIDNICDLKIVQLTPLRVLHRRTLMIRNKRIYEMRCVLINNSSGTYIKQFIHGDLQRTSPNLGSIIGCKCQCLQLDVLRILQNQQIYNINQQILI